MKTTKETSFAMALHKNVSSVAIYDFVSTAVNFEIKQEEKRSIVQTVKDTINCAVNYDLDMGNYNVY